MTARSRTARTRPLAFRVAIALVAASGIGLAHDFWIQPSNWTPSRSSRLTVDLRVGHPGESEPVARDPRLLRRFFARRESAPPEKDVPIVGQDGGAPAGYARPSEAGLWRIAYEAEPNWLELDAGKFERYLAEEGLESIVAERARLGESTAPGRELYARCAVAWIDVRDAEGAAGVVVDADGAERRPGTDEAMTAARVAPLGLALELVPSRSPSKLAAGDSLELTVLRRGEPIAGVQVDLDPLLPGSARSLSARSGEDGRVTLELPAAGAWLVTAVDMERAPDEVRTRAEKGADWISHWASLSFSSADRASDDGEAAERHADEH